MTSPDHILSFCSDCGGLLPAGLGQESEQVCPNCGSGVEKREFRIEGVFTEEEARKFKQVYGYDP